jgi:hypothetical protein
MCTQVIYMQKFFRVKRGSYFAQNFCNMSNALVTSRVFMLDALSHEGTREPGHTIDILLDKLFIPVEPMNIFCELKRQNK